MRVTHSLIANTVIRNINRNLYRLNKYQDMLSSGAAINKPSDDPVKITRIMGYATSLQQNEQYQRNLDAAESWINTTEDALAGMNDVLQRARELAVSGADGTKPAEARQAIAMEIDELINVLVQLGNTSLGGRYIFAGHKTTTVPFERNPAGDVIYHGDQGAITWEIAPSVTINGNIAGQSLLVDTEIFRHLEDLVAGLNTNDSEAINQALGALSDSIDVILDKRAALGAIGKGLEITKNKTTLEELNLTKLRSQLEDIDFAETIMHFSTMDTLYRASLSAGVRIMVPSLIDFLR